jgi:hypothetical protein
LVKLAFLQCMRGCGRNVWQHFFYIEETLQEQEPSNGILNRLYSGNNYNKTVQMQGYHQPLPQRDQDKGDDCGLQEKEDRARPHSH